MKELMWICTSYGLASGLSIPEFMEQFPNARAEHIKAVLNFQADRLDATSSQPAR